MSDTVDTSAEAVEHLARCLENSDWFSAAEMVRALLRERDEARAALAETEVALNDAIGELRNAGILGGHPRNINKLP